MFGHFEKYRSRKHVSLQLTSLLDMFTIILVFLLESFQADDEDFVLQADLQLPGSTARNPFKPAVNIAITPERVLVEGQPVYALGEGGVAAPEDLAAGKVEVIVTAVEQAWAVHQARGEDEVVATIQADELLPYDTVDLVMRSAGWAGCYRFRLVVEKE